MQAARNALVYMVHRSTSRYPKTVPTLSKKQQEQGKTPTTSGVIARIVAADSISDHSSSSSKSRWRASTFLWNSCGSESHSSAASPLRGLALEEEHRLASSSPRSQRSSLTCSVHPTSSADSKEHSERSTPHSTSPARYPSRYGR